MTSGQAYPAAQSQGWTDGAAPLVAGTEHAQAVLSRAAAHAVALARITLPNLPDPPLAAGPDRSILRAAAPLYFAMEVESTGITRALSALAGLFASGALRLPRGPQAEILMQHHRDYERRRPTDDRFAAYLRLFGTAPAGAVPFATEDAVNLEFEEAMLRLAEAMHRYAHLTPLHLAPTVAQREIRTAARLLGENLVMRGGGAAHYLAEEALSLIARATDVFKDRSVQVALGAPDLWGAIDVALGLAQGVGRRPRPGAGRVALARAHLTRGRSGMSLLEWLAEEAPRLAGLGQLVVPRDAPILAQGTEWLEATLSLLTAEETGLDAA
ncbi:MAG: hypothetical protein JSU82_17350 [Rhodospirillales bacterium]|nr:MAG: hypothetical protein JSU82_17350 [Rhodospirillales bacterium]